MKANVVISVSNLMYYPKQFALALSIILLCLNITPITGEYISASHEQMYGMFFIYIDHPLIAVCAGLVAVLVAVMAIRSRFYVEHTTGQR